MGPIAVVPALSPGRVHGSANPQRKERRWKSRAGASSWVWTPTRTRARRAGPRGQTAEERRLPGGGVRLPAASAPGQGCRRRRRCGGRRLSEGVRLLEVNRPSRQHRRAFGKNDITDTEAAPVLVARRCVSIETAS